MPQKVDPFIPVNPQPPRKRPVQQAPRVVNDIVVPRAPPKQKLDQLRPWYNVRKPQPLEPAPAAQPSKLLKPQRRPDPSPDPPTSPTVQPMPEQPLEPKSAQSRFGKMKSVLFAGKYVLIGAIILAAGMLLQIAAVGEVLIAIYAVLALVRRIESRTSFLLAFVSFGYIIVMLFTHPDQSLMKNFATYAFLFLLIGTVTMLREARYES